MVGLFGSLASKCGLLFPPALPVPDEASELILAFLGLKAATRPPSELVGVAVLFSAPGAACLLLLSSGYGKGPLGGGEVGAP